MIYQHNQAEFIGGIIDIFEDFLDEKGVVLESPERDKSTELDDGLANIYGSDYWTLYDSLEQFLLNWDVIK